MNLKRQQEFVRHGIFSCDALTIDEEGFLHPLKLVNALVKKAPHFSKQFVAYHGLDPEFIAILLDTKNPASLLCNMLELLGHLARSSKDYYQGLHEARILGHLWKILHHPDSSVKSKVCSLIGNLCRYSDYFYGSLEQHKLLSELTILCSDKDPSVRKFACFAIGNAGFHNDRLYEELQQCIPALAILLDDPDERTRANAAGALGNLTRNSNMLTQSLLKHGIVEKLLNTAEKVRTHVIIELYDIYVLLFSLSNDTLNRMLVKQ